MSRMPIEMKATTPCLGFTINVPATCVVQMDGNAVPAILELAF